ncbi:hypothetical protein F5Y06DRAFT_155843 [Hypoxylon sp. FL0890]|nr:hypothetical protein F5Y06DRAFT_155843 [Hypoxylon sp. FL0890]
MPAQGTYRRIGSSCSLHWSYHQFPVRGVGMASPSLSSLAAVIQSETNEIPVSLHQRPRHRRHLLGCTSNVAPSSEWPSAHARHLPAVIASYTLRPYSELE